MLTKPNLKDEGIMRCLRDAYGLNVKKISFLPLGADFNTAAYRVTTSSSTDYFLKLRSNDFNESSVLVPKHLADLGLKHILAPIPTRAGELCSNIASFKAILYPYIDGHNGVEKQLSKQQWIQFGDTIKALHNIALSAAITKSIPHENFSPKWRDTVKAILMYIEKKAFHDPVATEMALFLKSKSEEIFNLINHAENLASSLQQQNLGHTLCHADIHLWNLLIDKRDDLYIVDWDTLIFAPKERDLMFIGAGIEGDKSASSEEESLFYQGYGQININPNAICYYRLERIIQDIGEYCEHIFLSDESCDDRMQSFEYLQSNFLPSGTIEIACQFNKTRETQ